MNTVNIRPATSNDLPIIYEFVCLLEEQQFDFPTFSACFETCINNADNYYLVVEINGQVIGYLSCHGQILLHHCGMVYEIQEMYVHEHFRSLGVGKLLLAKLEEILSTQTYDVLEVSSNMRREDAHRFYLSNGFEQTTYKFKKAPVKIKTITVG